MASGIADHTPMVLCQLKSRALPGRPPRNQMTCFTARQAQVRGIQR